MVLGDASHEIAPKYKNRSDEDINWVLEYTHLQEVGRAAAELVAVTNLKTHEFH